ncbi:U-box domain-containing protein 70-like [Miscanthus floridulus]|uniref:U-box domain-containing protein 70-like n=1 Tax=Miscanthus floridulus TaxID=154761 RepID=UPI0034590D16
MSECQAFSNRALCHIHLGAFPQGLEDAEKCIELDPNFLKGYVCKAKVQFLMESYENALATYLEGLKCDPNNLEVLDGLRRCAACVKGSNAGDVVLEDLKYVDIEELKDFMEQLAPRDSEMDFVLEGQGETDPPATQNQLGQIASSQLDKNQR